MDIAAGSVVDLSLPAVDDYLTVGCHAEDGHSGICTYYPGESRTLGFTVREGSILVDSG